MEKGEPDRQRHLPGRNAASPLTPRRAPRRASASRYLDQPQDVTAVSGGGRADHEFSHFRLLLLFPLRTRPLYLNNRRKWFFIRFPGASSSQSGGHHDPGSFGERQKHLTRSEWDGMPVSAVPCRLFLPGRSTAPACEAVASRPMRLRLPSSFLAPPSILGLV